MNILLTGATGYIGSFLLQNWYSKNDQLDIIVRKPLQFIDYSNFINTKLYLADISQPIELELDKEYDIFIHLAGANDIDSIDTSIALSHTTLTTKNSLAFCGKKSIKKFIYFSTFQVYGKLEGFIDESSPKSPLNDYAITHLFAEEYVKMYHRIHQIDFINIIPTNIYGSPIHKEIDRWSLVPNCFCLEAFNDHKITLKSSGNQNRDFISLKDISSITQILCNDFDQYKNQTINVSSGNQISILEIAKLVKKEYESIFNINCPIEIMTEHPKIGEEFNINRKKINPLNYTFDTKDALIEQIKQIFKILNS